MGGIDKINAKKVGGVSLNKNRIYDQNFLKALAEQLVKILNGFPHSLGGETNCLRGDIPPPV